MSGWHYPDDSARGPWDGPDYDDRDWDTPDPGEQYEMDFWNQKRHYPRGQGPPFEGSEDYPEPSRGDPIYTPDEAPDPNLIHDPGFQEHEVDTHPDPDHMRDYRQGAVGDPWDEEAQRRFERGRADAEEGAYAKEVPWLATQRQQRQQVRNREERVGGILTQAQQWPDRVAGIQSEAFGHPGIYQFEDEQPHHLLNRDPGLADSVAEGSTVPHFVGGDPHGDIPIVPREHAGPGDAFVMPDSESGLGYAAIVRKNEHGGHDVIRPLH